LIITFYKIMTIIMKNLKTSLAFLAVFLCMISMKAQVGIGTVVPDGALDVTSTTDGLLIPRVALTITTSALPLTLPTVSELVYNSATVADVTPGYYYWNGTIWVRLASGVTTNWSVLGNTGIVDGTNFIGTAALTNVDVAFRRNNLPSGKIGLTSTSFGVGALNVGAASNSSAFGTNALTLNTGANNVAVGNGSLAANTTGSTNVAVGNSTLAANITGIQNTGVGNNALLLNTGSASTAVGFEALRANTTGNNGTAVGFQALSRNTGASNNTAIGFQTMLNNTIGSENTAVGFQASSIGASGTKNTAVGYIALNNNIGSENTAFGHSSMSGINNAASRFNTAIGFQSMFAGIGNVSNVVAVGANALFQNTASNTVGVGYNALQGQGAGGTGNTGVGFSVLNNNTTGDNNTAMGSEAGFAAVGSGNTMIGFRAGQFASNATGAGTFVGFQAGLGTTGANNTAIGNNALVATGASANNVAVGNNSLTANTSTNNTAIGFSALINNITGTGNVAIGNQAGFSEVGSNKLYITNSNTTPITSLIYGEFSPSRILRTNSTFQIGDPAGTGYVFPIARGAVNQVLQTDAVGVLTWVNPSSLSVTETDPQVSSATNNRIPKWNGTTLVDGIVTDNGTTVTVAGTTSTTNLQMTAGATANYVLQSDGTGNGTWVNPSTLSITETDPQVTSVTNNTIPKWNGTTLVDGIVTDNGTTVSVAGTTSTTNLQMTAGATANYFLQSDATGNAAWAPIPVNTVKPYLTTGVLTGVYNVPLTEYTVRVFNGVSEVRLPAATGNTGKVFIVIGSNAITSKIFSTAGGIIYDDVSNAIISTINPNERYMVQSDGIDWIVIGR
jgi:trimeric autotransporter adhesin